MNQYSTITGHNNVSPQGYTLLISLIFMAAVGTIVWNLLSVSTLTQQDSLSNRHQFEMKRLNTQTLFEQALAIDPKNIARQLEVYAEDRWLPLFQGANTKPTEHFPANSLYHRVHIKSPLKSVWEKSAWKNGYSLNNSQTTTLLFSASTQAAQEQQFGQTIGLQWVAPVSSHSRQTTPTHSGDTTPSVIRWQCQPNNIDTCSYKSVVFIQKQLTPTLQNQYALRIEMIDADTQRILWHSQAMPVKTMPVKAMPIKATHERSTITVIKSLNPKDKHQGDGLASKVFAVDHQGGLWRWDINSVPTSADNFANGDKIAQMSPSHGKNKIMTTVYTAPDLALLSLKQQPAFLAIAFAALTRHSNQASTLNIYVVKDPYPFAAPSSYHYIQTPSGLSRRINHHDLTPLHDTSSALPQEPPNTPQDDCPLPSSTPIWGYHFIEHYEALIAQDDITLSDPLIINKQVILGVQQPSINQTHLIDLDISRWQRPSCATAHRWQWPDSSPSVVSQASPTWRYLKSKPSTPIQVCFAGACRADMIHHPHTPTSGTTANGLFSTPYGPARLWFWGINTPM